MPDLFTTVDQVMLYMRDKFRERTEFGFQYVDYGDPDDIIPGTPALILTNGPETRTLHGTHTFALILTIELWVLHADGTVSTAQRRLDGIILCNQVQDFLHQHMTLEDQVIQGWVSGRSPGVLARKGALYVATRMVWDGISEERF